MADPKSPTTRRTRGRNRLPSPPRAQPRIVIRAKAKPQTKASTPQQQPMHITAPNAPYALSTIQIAQILDSKIEKFSGESTETILEDWLDRFKEILIFFGITIGQARTLLPLYLTGSAKIKYDLIANKDQKTWTEVITEFLQKCKNEQLIQNVRNELTEIQQGSKSVGEFAKIIRDKCRVGYQGVHPKDIEKNMIFHFLHGLNQEIKYYVRRLPTPRDFEQAISIAEKEDRICKQERREREREEVNILELSDQLDKLKLELQKVREKAESEKIEREEFMKKLREAREEAEREREEAEEEEMNYHYFHEQYYPEWYEGQNSRNNGYYENNGYDNHQPEPEQNLQHTTNGTQHPPQNNFTQPFRPLKHMWYTQYIVCIFLLVCLTPVAGYQTCGSDQGGIFIHHTSIKSNDLILKYQPAMYSETNQILEFTAHKCSRRLDALKLFSHHFDTTTTSRVQRSNSNTENRLDVFVLFTYHLGTTTSIILFSSENQQQKEYTNCKEHKLNKRATNIHTSTKNTNVRNTQIRLYPKEESSLDFIVIEPMNQLEFNKQRFFPLYIFSLNSTYLNMSLSVILTKSHRTQPKKRNQPMTTSFSSYMITVAQRTNTTTVAPTQAITNQPIKNVENRAHMTAFKANATQITHTSVPRYTSSLSHDNERTRELIELEKATNIKAESEITNALSYTSERARGTEDSEKKLVMWKDCKDIDQGLGKKDKAIYTIHKNKSNNNIIRPKPVFDKKIVISLSTSRKKDLTCILIASKYEDKSSTIENKERKLYISTQEVDKRSNILENGKYRDNSASAKDIMTNGKYSVTENTSTTITKRISITTCSILASVILISINWKIFVIKISRYIKNLVVTYVDQVPHKLTFLQNVQKELTFETFSIPKVYALHMKDDKTESPQVIAQLNDIETTCLIDTGSTISYIRFSTLGKIDYDFQRINLTPTGSAIVANGTKINFYGSALISVKISEIWIQLIFLISDDETCPAPAVLGADYIRLLNSYGYNFSLNLIKNTLHIGEYEVSLFDNRHQTPTVSYTTDKTGRKKVRILEDTLVEPKSEIIIPIRINTANLRSNSYLLEETYGLDEEIYLLSRIVKPNGEGKCFTKVYNPSSTEVKLYQHTIIAYAQVIGKENEIKYVMDQQSETSERHWGSNISHSSKERTYDQCRDAEIDRHYTYSRQQEIEWLEWLHIQDSRDSMKSKERREHYNIEIEHTKGIVEKETTSRKVYRIASEKYEEVIKQVEEILENHSEKPPPELETLNPIMLVIDKEEDHWRFEINPQEHDLQPNTDLV